MSEKTDFIQDYINRCIKNSFWEGFAYNEKSENVRKNNKVICLFICEYLLIKVSIVLFLI